MRRLKVGNAPSTVRDCPTASEVVDNTIGAADLQTSHLSTSLASQDAPQLSTSVASQDTPQLSTSLASQDTLKMRVARAQRKIQDKKKPNTTTQARDNVIQGTISLLYGNKFHAKKEQVTCIRRLIYNRIDVILIAQTGFGKSLIMQVISILCKNTTSLVFLPLNEIVKEQVQKVNQIGGNALLLNADVKDIDKAIENARAGLYTHIFISPELASTPDFRSLLKDPKFKKRLALVVVDKAHLITQWGKKFRPEYAQLRYVRNLIGSSVPWFACSATLDPETLETVKKLLGFNDTNMHLEQTSIARKELVFRLGQIPKDKIAKYTSLRFLLDEAVDPPTIETYIDPAVFQGGSRLATPHKIPKTIVFFNTKLQAIEAHRSMSKYLQQLYPA